MYIMLILKITESMAALFSSVGTSILSTSIEYGVDLFIFAFLYFGLAPLVWISAGLTVRNLKNQKPIGILLAVFLLTFLSPYAYILYAGKNLSIWVYLIIVGLAGFGLFKFVSKLRVRKSLTPQSE